MTALRYRIIDTEGSQSFPEGDAFLAGRSPEPAEVVIVVGLKTGEDLKTLPIADHRAVLVELGAECLGVHAPEDFGAEDGLIVGFNRFRLGDAPPTNLIELVRQPRTDQAALDAATTVFGEAGFTTVVCNDAPGRIVDRLARPYFNRALNALDTGLSDADQLDSALRMGLGHRRGPIDLLRESGLAHHFGVSSRLHAALGEAAYHPARAAQVAAERENLKRAKGGGS